MNFSELEYFTAIARHGNITHAAEELYVSQPTLSKFLQRFEAEAGTPLFARMGHRLELTYAGRRYLARAEELLNGKRALDAEMADIRREACGELRVGMPHFRCSYSLPAVLPAFKKLHPQIGIQILESSSEALDAALLEGKIDLAFYFHFAAPDPRLEYRTLAHDAVYVILSRGHPAGKQAVAGANGPELPLEALEGETFLLQSRTQRQGQYIYEQLSRHHITPRQIMETTNIRAAAALAANGYGVAFLAGELLRHFESPTPFDAYLLADSPPFDFVAACRRNDYLTGYAQDFIRLMSETQGK